ncbi:baseplate J/gp47 family protein [Paenibacillus sp. J5C_2022]|uniref:baseplate J/gp47 family protein n=1 Tax=Paenibacillus sp. J5C2022 TaxID=2977129 RepID=UPI0021CE24C7|nr:baseplate J/gp47 family protein [Paenibacillus sp. J5C2022]MCU6709394.1 baseplate J/gp47 family protein [Paenibacillus sp. J5C2022]
MATKEEILITLLNLVDDKHDKRVGSFIYDALSPVAERLADIDLSISETKTKMIIDNLTGDELTQRVKERTGIDRNEAIKAKGQVTLTGTGTINIGDIFETEGGIQFESVESKAITGSGTVNIQAIDGGISGNVSAGTIRLFPVTLAGFTAVTNNPTEGGYDEESDFDLIKRYYDYLRNPATSGNQAAYVSWAKSVDGVGDVKVLPAWDGGNTVKLVIIDVNKEPASQPIVDSVKEYIDSSTNGIGSGVAPIGVVLTVEPATAHNLTIDVDVDLETGYTIEQVEETISQHIEAYLRSIAFVKNNVSFAKIGSAILDSEGVNNYTSLLINGAASNVALDVNEVPVLIGVNVT